MGEFRRPSDRNLTRGDGRNMEIIDANVLKYVNQVYFSRPPPQQQPYSFDSPSSFDKKQHVAATNNKRRNNKRSSMSIKSWWNDPNLKRKRRLTKYKMYALEGKLKESLKKGQRWIKIKYRKIVHGY